MTSTVDDDLERALRTLFRRQAAAIETTAADDDGVLVVELAGLPRRPRSRARVVAVAAVALAAAVSGIVAIGGSSGVRGRGPAAAGNAVHWSTPYVDLSADDFSIAVSGQTYTAAGADVQVHSDPGDATYQTLELGWHEHGHLMLWNIYLQSDGHDWWAFEMRTYDGLDPGDWVTFAGDHFRTPLGSPYTGDLDLTATDHGITSHLVARGLRLQAFVHTRTNTGLPPLMPTGTTTPPNAGAATPAG
jgi:hypothetical protein